MNLFFAWRWLPETRTEAVRKEQAPNKRPVWSATLDVVRHPAAPVSRMIWIYGVGMLAFSFLTAILPIWLGAEMGVTAMTIGPVFTYIAGLSFLIRVVALFLTGIYFPKLFDASHTVVWQTLVILSGVLLWIFWANRFAAPAPAEPAA